MQGRLYIFWPFYNCGCLTMKFSRSALISAAPIPEFGGNSLVFLTEEEQPNYRKLCWRLCRWHFSQTWITTSSIRIRCTSPFHELKNNADTSIPWIVARSVQLGWSSIQSAFLLFPLNSGASILLFKILSVVIAVLGSSITRIHVREHKRTWGRFHPLRDI